MPYGPWRELSSAGLARGRSQHLFRTTILIAPKELINIWCTNPTHLLCSSSALVRETRPRTQVAVAVCDTDHPLPLGCWR